MATRVTDGARALLSLNLKKKRDCSQSTLVGSHFHGWIDYNGVAFSFELLEWDRTFSGFGGSETSRRYGFEN